VNVINAVAQPGGFSERAAHVAASSWHRQAELSGTGETVTLEADQVFKSPSARPLFPMRWAEPRRCRSRAAGSPSTTTGRTSVARVWAGGDCVAGDDLTVTAVAQRAATPPRDIHRVTH
jgi:NADPH-dependent glutamate synthase beta subunit-like oxidoreductase